MGWEEGGAIGNRGQSRDWKGVKKGGRREEEGEREYRGRCHKENGRPEEGREKPASISLFLLCRELTPIFSFPGLHFSASRLVSAPGDAPFRPKSRCSAQGSC